MKAQPMHRVISSKIKENAAINRTTKQSLIRKVAAQSPTDFLMFCKKTE